MIHSFATQRMLEALAQHVAGGARHAFAGLERQYKNTSKLPDGAKAAC